MTLFRSVLFWLVLAVLGALLAQVLLQDPGYVLVRFRGTDYTPSVAACTRAAAHTSRVCGWLHNIRSTASMAVSGLAGSAVAHGASPTRAIRRGDGFNGKC